MENNNYTTAYSSSYPNSRDSSPRSREIDCESPAWEEQQQQHSPTTTLTYKVKLMCSYGGKIQPRPHDNQLAYVDGDTKILSVDRNIKYSAFMSKLSSFSESDFCFKYQLPGEDLDALISVTNDEDLDHMMLEYDRVYHHHASAKPARLRLFLFPLNPVSTSFDSNSSKSERQWFVDALNAIQIQSPVDNVSPTAQISPKTPDYLFGLDKGVAAAAASSVPVTKLLQDPPPPAQIAQISKDNSTGSDQGSEERNVVRDAVMSQVEIQRQIQELQRLQVVAAASQDQGILQVRDPGEYYAQKGLVAEKVAPVPQQTVAAMQMPMARAYWPEQQQQQHMTGGGGTYQVATAAAAAAPRRDQQAVYLIPTAHTGMYQTSRAVGNQAYYGMQRVNTEVYREQQQQQQPIYNVNVVPSSSIGMGMGMAVRAPTATMGMAEGGYAQVAYDATGRLN